MSLGELRYSKATTNPVRVVVAVARTRQPRRCDDLPQGLRVSTEYPQLTGRFFADRGIEADVRLSYGASEAKIPDIADCIVDITETGRALRAAGLRIIDTILVSYTEVVANAESHADPAKHHAMGQLMTLLNGTLEARDKVLVKLNVSRGGLRAGAAAGAGAQGADGVGAGRGRRLRHRDGRAQEPDQRPDPRPQGRRRHRHPRAADLQDHPLMRGRVTEFDEARGLGTITAEDGQSYPFHCTQLTDGSRQVDTGQAVRFDPLPKLGGTRPAPSTSWPPARRGRRATACPTRERQRAGG